MKPVCPDGKECDAVNFLRVRGAWRVHGTLRGMLVTVQVALALVVLASAGLLLKNLQKLVKSRKPPEIVGTHGNRRKNNNPHFVSDFEVYESHG